MAGPLAGIKILDFTRYQHRLGGRAGLAKGF